MSKPLSTHESYLATKAKLADLERRLARLQARDDLTPQHRAEVLRSYESMMDQYRRDIRAFEADPAVGEGVAGPGATA